MSTQLKQYAAHRLRHRLLRSVPWLGGVVALVALGGAMRRKGVLGGTLDTALDMIPFVGATKNLCEVTRGRDFIRDKEMSVLERDVRIGSGSRPDPDRQRTLRSR
jgi:hypothetical protein